MQAREQETVLRCEELIAEIYSSQVSWNSQFFLFVQMLSVWSTVSAGPRVWQWLVVPGRRVRQSARTTAHDK